MSLSISETLVITALEFRLCRGESDFPAIVDINNASWPVDDRLDVDTFEACRAAFASIENLDLMRDLLIAEVDGIPVAYALVLYGDNADTKGAKRRWFDVEATIVPAWRRKRLGRAMQNWLEQRALEIAQSLPPVLDTYLTSTTRDKNVGRAVLLKQFGFKAVNFWFGMEHSLTEPQPEYALPEGLEVRPVRPEHFRAILAAQMDALRETRDPSKMPTDIELQDFAHFATDQMNQYELWQVAWEGDQVAGMVLNNIDLRGNKILGLNRGFTDPICTGHAWRRRGLAKALLSRSLNVLRAAGVEKAFLGVDTQNPHEALRLYEQVGFVVVKSGTTYEKHF